MNFLEPKVKTKQNKTKPKNQKWCSLGAGSGLVPSSQTLDGSGPVVIPCLTLEMRQLGMAEA